MLIIEFERTTVFKKACTIVRIIDPLRKDASRVLGERAYEGDPPDVELLPGRVYASLQLPGPEDLASAKAVAGK